MPIQVTFTDDPARVLREAGDFLASEPVLHNLILTLLHQRIASPDPGRYWVARSGADVAGVVLQTPLQNPATLTPMRPEVAGAMADGIAQSGIALPGVNGEAATAARFAGQWTERTKSAAIPFQGMRLYEFLEPGERLVAQGKLRSGLPGDRDLVVEWVRLFETEIGEPHSDPSRVVASWLQSGTLWIWDDQGPVSMTVTRQPTAGVVRVAPVFTPADKRKSGYAGACVSDLSHQIRAQGHRLVLYTDLGNPTSNSIYRRIGYRAVAEALRYRFE
ncbi:MAG TPA: GNAT family N-acetyltransferase [Bryobacteraceae bacterium]|nr:GNAT family N-acetyltransferase [Bryobacteraceae bacterium]